MSQVNITPVYGSEIESLRHNVAVATESAYGAMRKYAEGLCGVLPAEWYLVEHNDSSDTAKPVHAEKKALFAELKAVNHSNPSTIWARVRKYAQEFMEGAPEKSEGGEGESVGKRETRSLELRLVEDLTALWKACGRAESLSDKQSQCKTHIGSALTAMGVDLSLIK